MLWLAFCSITEIEKIMSWSERENNFVKELLLLTLSENYLNQQNKHFIGNYFV